MLLVSIPNLTAYDNPKRKERRGYSVLIGVRSKDAIEHKDTRKPPYIRIIANNLMLAYYALLCYNKGNIKRKDAK